MQLHILTIGDVVGAPGRDLVVRELPALRRRFDVDFVVANAENVTRGSGVATKDARALLEAGVDVLTCGDHVWRLSETVGLVESEPRVLRAANLPRGVPGRDFYVGVGRSGIEIAVFHLLGRVFMQPADCPFAAADRVLERLSGRTRIVVVDAHCEATSESVALGRHLEGRASVVFGTHTHVPTADLTVLPGGTGYVTDVGMTGPYESVLGRRIDRVLHRFRTGMPARFDVATGDVRLLAALFVVDAKTGRCVGAERVEVRAEREVET